MKFPSKIKMEAYYKRVGRRQMYRQAAAAVQNEVKSLKVANTKDCANEAANSSSFEG